MYAAVDSRELYQQPIRDHNENWAYFFMFFMVVGGYLFLNLFVTIMIESFNKQKEAADGSKSLFLTEMQQVGVKTRLALLQINPTKVLKKPGTPLGDACFRVAMDPNFDVFIMGCITANTL